MVKIIGRLSKQDNVVREKYRGHIGVTKINTTASWVELFAKIVDKKGKKKWWKIAAWSENNMINYGWLWIIYTLLDSLG